jgi:O-acetylhomoserine/O-acetylserine sulfhydrylase-like pyridoxal-dependent enzyme
LTIHTANTTHAIVSPMEREDLGLEEDMIGGLVGSSGITAQ